MREIQAYCMFRSRALVPITGLKPATKKREDGDGRVKCWGERRLIIKSLRSLERANTTGGLAGWPANDDPVNNVRKHRAKTDNLCSAASELSVAASVLECSPVSVAVLWVAFLLRVC
jgi:hypothetical protein